MSTLHPAPARTRGLDALTLGVLAGTFAITASLYARLPARIPVHFDLRGVANGWASRTLGAWLLPAILLAVFAFVRVGARLLPSAWRARTDTRASSQVLLVVTLGLVALHFLMLRVALVGATAMGASLGAVLGALWIALALVMPRLRRNPWMGVRTAWTLSSDENWARTHRVAGIAMAIGGVMALLGALAGSNALAMVAILASALVPMVYSFLLARRLRGE